jgi:PhzF family phenazine biosynthesis protein
VSPGRVKLPIYEVAAFARAPFSGNPAGVCPLERWLPDATLQAIAAENNLPETAFFVPRDDGFDLRWFSPTSEINLCGHATLATAWVLFHRLGRKGERITFESKSGPLSVTRRGELLELDFPAWPAQPREAPPGLVEALGARPRELLGSSRDLVAVFASAEEVAGLRPNFEKLGAIDTFGVIATAAGNGAGKDGADYVLRFFAPRAGIPEDPATGSAHCTLAPLWSARLGRTRLTARQLSGRGGDFACEHRGDRVGIGGAVVPYLEGSIEIPG